MEKAWEIKLKNVSKIVFNSGKVVLSSDNKLLCLNSKGVVWSRKMFATFYRDPYGDASITALDANQFHVVAGTNFMDGKVYLFSIDGKLHWMHQFATIASLGWRPEDVTAVKLNKEFVIIGTEFMNEYIHVYTINRKRILQKRVSGRVEDFSLLENKLIVGTNDYLYLFDIISKEEYKIENPTNSVEAFEDRIVVSNNRGITVYKYDGLDIKKYWSAWLQNPIWCLVEKDVVLASENLLNYISADGEVKWQKTINGEITNLFYDKASGKIYVGVKNGIQVYSKTGKCVESLNFDGEPLKIGKIDGKVAIVTHNGGRVSLTKL